MSAKTAHGRKWLNSATSYDTGSIQWKITRYSTHKDDIGGDITIRDCSRSISLNLSSYDAKERANALRKVDILLDELTKVKAALFAAAPKA